MAKQEKDNGTEEQVQETVEEVTGEAQGEGQTKAKGTSPSKTINEAIKQVESFTENLGKALGNALQDRANVVMVRVNDDSLSYLDMLVDADVTKSRSESAAFLINEGIKANEPLFEKIREITDQISALRAQLRDTVHTEG
jgi:hypothetical protein